MTSGKAGGMICETFFILSNIMLCFFAMGKTKILQGVQN